MKKALIASAVSAAAAQELNFHLIDKDDPNFVLSQPHYGKRNKKGKAKKDWHK